MLSIQLRVYRMVVLALFCWMAIPSPVNSQPLTGGQIDSLVNKATEIFNVPGMALAIVKDGRVIHTKGYGLRSIATRQPVDGNTLFGIASNSKAFTAAALGILVSDGKLKWDDKITDYIPEFMIFDPYVTSQFTVIDLITHRSGLGLNEGDLLHTPDSTDYTISDVIHSLRYLKPASSFRSKFAYDNILYLVAAELVKRVSGISWQEFVETRIMKPLQMANSGSSYVRVKHSKDIIDGHFVVDGKLKVLSKSDQEGDAGAGGIYSSAADMGKWMLMQLHDGRYGPGLKDSLFTKAIHQEMWTPQVIIPVHHPGIYRTHFGAYGLGWFLTDACGYLEVSHTGQDDGMISAVELIPELNLGITVLSNQEGGGGVMAVLDQVTDGYLGIKGVDHIKEYADRVKSNNQSADTANERIWRQVRLNQKSGVKLDTAIYTGVYRDNWFGDINIYKERGHIWFKSKRSLQLKGELHFYKGNTFVVKWNNPELKVDAFVSFVLDNDGSAKRIVINAVSPGESPGFDFQDLDFGRIR